MKYTALLLLFLLQFNLVFAQNQCDLHFLKTLTLKLSGKTNENEMVTILSGDKLTAFEQFLSEKKLVFEHLSPIQKKNYFLESLEKQFNRYKDESYTALEKNQSRLDYLKLRGHKMSGTNAAEIMQKQSSINLKRALGNEPKHIYGTEEWREVEQLVSSLELHFKHNTQILSEETTIPVLSAKRLEEIVGFGGLNSRFSFNKEILKSDDSVYFVPQPNIDGKYHARAGEYGAYSMFLNDAYASEHGMISTFVMYEDELMLWGEINAPEIIKKMNGETIQFYLGLSDEEKFNFKELMRIDWMYSVEQGQFKLDRMLRIGAAKPNFVQPELIERWKQTLSPQLKELRQKLYLTDYTTADFLSGLKEIILQETVKMKAAPSDVQNLKSAFSEGHWKYSAILNRSLKRMGIPNEGMTFPLELTVPVNVPAAEIKHQK